MPEKSRSANGLLCHRMKFLARALLPGRRPYQAIEALRQELGQLTLRFHELNDTNVSLRGQVDDHLHQINQLEMMRAAYEDLKAASVGIDRNGVEVLADADFQEGCRLAAGLTLLDVPRLANIWQLLQLSNPRGNVAELGVFQGGCSVLMAMAAPNRHFFLCDTFTGFGALRIDPLLDSAFQRTQFDHTSAELVSEAMARVTQNFELVQGYFPASDPAGRVRDISFAHIDLDLHQSTLSALRYLADKVTPRSILVLDDYVRGAPGVMKAVSEFLATDNSFVAFPMFPGQGVMFHRSWFADLAA
jgi:hypothetical protein